MVGPRVARREDIDKRVLAAVGIMYKKSGSPTYQEVAQAIGESISTVWDSVLRLEEKGLIARHLGKHRSVRPSG